MNLPSKMCEIHSEASNYSMIVRDNDYQTLRLKLVDSVAKAMQLEFQHLPLPASLRHSLIH